MKALVLAAGMASMVIGSGVAFAQANDWMSVGSLTSKLEAQGYTVREVERDDGRYEVDVTDSGGVRYELKVDRTSGEILKRERDD